MSVNSHEKSLLVPGDLLVIKWLDLDSPICTYIIIAVDDPGVEKQMFWFFREGDERIHCCSVLSIDPSKQHEFQIIDIIHVNT